MLVSDGYFIDQFNKYFQSLRKSLIPVVFYGIGEKTQLLLARIRGYNVVGLMDKKSTGKTIYGLPVLSDAEVAEKAKCIIIVANMSVAPLIYQRIAFLEKERNLDIFYLNGTKPSEKQLSVNNSMRPEPGVSDLIQAINHHDIISFDLFDTLIMRKVLAPTDIFSVVERRLLEERQLHIDFKNRRIEAEYVCYRNQSKYCNLYDIYGVLSSLLKIDDQLKATLLQLEIETELTYCAPRPALIDSLCYAKLQGKTVLITTDTFWTRDLLHQLLDRCDIRDPDRLLISCEEKKLKYLGDMWPHIQQLYPERKILHIGDNPKTDVEIPQRYGVNVFKVSSALEVLSAPSLKPLYQPPVALDDSILLGQLSAGVLHDPWILDQGKGKLPIDDPFRLGYLSFGPLILNYLLWLLRESRRQGLSKLLFFARDGYILHQLYRKLTSHYSLDGPAAVYFLTSRRAASVAAVVNKQDVAFILNKVCKVKSLRIRQVLTNAFGIEADPEDAFADRRCYELEEKTLTQHIADRYLFKILENSSEERQNYLAYIKSAGLTDDDRLGCVNFVGRGITQLFMSRILQQDLSGFYFAREVDMLDIYDRPEKCRALYDGYISPHTGRSHLAMKFIFGEIILSSPDEQLIHFDKHGLPVYEQRNGTRDFRRIQACHQGIDRLIENMMTLDDRLPERQFCPALVDELYGFFSGPGSFCSADIKQMFVFNDYYNPDLPDLALHI